MRIKPIGKNEGHTIPRYIYPCTENFEDAIKHARDTAQEWQKPAYLGYHEGKGWWVDAGDFLPHEPDLVVNPDGTVWPFWVTQPDDQEVG